MDITCQAGTVMGVAAAQRAVDAALDHPGEVRHLLQHPPKEQAGGAESSPMTITRRDMPPSSFDIAHEPELLHRLRIDVHAAGSLLNPPQERLGPESEHLLQFWAMSGRSSTISQVSAGSLVTS